MSINSTSNGTVAPGQSQLKSKEEAVVFKPQVTIPLQVKNYALNKHSGKVITEIVKQWMNLAHKKCEELKSADSSKAERLVFKSCQITCSLIHAELAINSVSTIQVCQDHANHVQGLMLTQFHDVILWTGKQVEFPGKFLKISHLASHPANIRSSINANEIHRAAGAGTALLSYAAALAVQQKAAGIYLESFDSAVEFYKKAGFEHIPNLQLRVLTCKKQGLTGPLLKDLLILRGKQLNKLAQGFFQSLMPKTISAPLKSVQLAGVGAVVVKTQPQPQAPAVTMQAQAKQQAHSTPPAAAAGVSTASSSTPVVQLQAKEKAESNLAPAVPAHILQTTSLSFTEENRKYVEATAEEWEATASVLFFKADKLPEDMEIFKACRQISWLIYSGGCHPASTNFELEMHVCKDSAGAVQGLMVTKLHPIASSGGSSKPFLEISLLTTNPKNIRSTVNKNEKTRLQGVGKSMIAHTIKRATALNALGIYLEPIPSSVNFYKKWGFKDVQRQDFFNTFALKHVTDLVVLRAEDFKLSNKLLG